MKIRDQEIRTKLTHESLSGTEIRKVSLRASRTMARGLRFLLKENVPGSYPYTAGVFAFKREGEDPTRMFAGEGDALPHQSAIQTGVPRACRRTACPPPSIR